MSNDVLSEIQKRSWQVWLYRPYAFLVAQQMVFHATRAAFKSQGIDGEYPIAVYDSHTWYGNEEMFRLSGEEAEKYLKKTSIFLLTRQCEKLYKKAKAEINNILLDNTGEPLDLFKKVIDLIAPLNVYVWVAHGAEEYYKPVIRKQASTLVSGQDLDKFIGDISMPAKMSAYNLLEADIYRGMDVGELCKRYAWMKTRISGGFTRGYTIGEMRNIQQEILSKSSLVKTQVAIPDQLKNLVAEIQEVIYLRTFRTDALFELYYLARPIFKRVEQKLNIKSVGNYSPDDILSGNLKEMSPESAILKFYDQIKIFRQSVVSSKADISQEEVKGVVAWKGRLIGKVKIIKSPEEINKIEEGEILVTVMTVPAYILAMNKAGAIVTDEGGLTCHAAIIAREMQKPCIIGTKNATRVLKDGDMVEVDAERGVVKLINL